MEENAYKRGYKTGYNNKKPDKTIVRYNVSDWAKEDADNYLREIKNMKIVEIINQVENCFLAV
ncbi:MAG TPA: hypothetical protein ENG24_02830 [Thermoplasmatales archaeon]|nr:hypothetical protein [Thermoplasmatales archaeon]